MAPCHTRRPRSVTEQPPLTPVRVAAGARNHRWTSDQRNISAPPIVATGSGTRHRDGSVVNRVNAASRRRVGTCRAGLPLVATRRAGRVIARPHHRWFGTLPLRCRCHRQSVARSSNSTVSLVGVTSIALGLLGWWITIRAQHRWVGSPRRRRRDHRARETARPIARTARRVPLDLHTDLRVCPLALPRGAAFTPRMTAHLPNRSKKPSAASQSCAASTAISPRTSDTSSAGVTCGRRSRPNRPRSRS